MTRCPARPSRVGAALLLFALVLAAYAPVLRAGFIWDDDLNLTENPVLQKGVPLSRMWTDPKATYQYYPTVFTFFRIERRLFGGNPLGFHLVNLLLHAAAAVLLWRVLARCRVPGAWLGGALFALHPVQVETAAWITEGKNTLSTALALIAALAWLHFSPPGEDDAPPAHPWRWYVFALAAFTLAVLAKSVTAVVPLLLIILRWWKRGRVGLRDVVPLVPFFVVGAALGLQSAWLERTHVGAAGTTWELSFAGRALVAGRALWFYLGKLAWPGGLAFIYPRWDVDTSSPAQWLFPCAYLALLGGLWVLRERIGRGPAAALAVHAVAVAPALGFLNVYFMRYSFVADHFQYLASVGPLALAAAGIARWSGRRGRTGFLAVSALLLAALGALTFRQSGIYRDAESLWRATIAANPGAWMAHGNLGLILEAQGRRAEALAHAEKAYTLAPGEPESSYNLGFVLASLGRDAEAEKHYRETLRIAPRHSRALANLALLLDRRGAVGEALDHYREAARLEPSNAGVRAALGSLLARTGHPGEAVEHLREAVRLEPGRAAAQFNLAGALLERGGQAEAEAHYREAARLAPRDADVRNGYGAFLAGRGDLARAGEEFRAALAADPTHEGARLNLERLSRATPEQ